MTFDEGFHVFLFSQNNCMLYICIRIYIYIIYIYIGYGKNVRHYIKLAT